MARLHLAPYLVSAASGRSVAACPPPVCAAGACVATARGPADPGSAVLSVKLNPSESILADAARPRFRQSPRGRPVRPTFLYILLHSITLYYTLLHSLPAERRLQGNIHFGESRPDLNDPPAPAGGISEAACWGSEPGPDLNDPPAPAGGISEGACWGSEPGLDLNDPPAPAGGISEACCSGSLAMASALDKTFPTEVRLEVQALFQLNCPAIP